MVTGIIILVLTLLGADALYSRLRVGLRRRAASQAPKPAWDLTSPVREGWRPLAEAAQPVADSPESEDADLSRLFRGRRG